MYERFLFDLENYHRLWTESNCLREKLWVYHCTGKVQLSLLLWNFTSKNKDLCAVMLFLSRNDWLYKSFNIAHVIFLDPLGLKIQLPLNSTLVGGSVDAHSVAPVHHLRYGFNVASLVLFVCFVNLLVAWSKSWDLCQIWDCFRQISVTCFDFV